MIEAIATTLGAGLALGLVGSVHCLGMCGGIAGALTQSLPPGATGSRALRSALHSLGRTTSYAAAGGAVGTLGSALLHTSGLEITLRLTSGLLIVAVALHVGGWWNGVAAIERVGFGVWRRIAPLAQRIGRPDRGWKIFATGLLWGWLPCGLVYSSLAISATLGSAAAGALFMASFGLGTLPALLLTSTLTDALGRVVQHRVARRSAAVLLLTFGVWTLLGALAPLALEGAHEHHPVVAHDAQQRSG